MSTPRRPRTPITRVGAFFCFVPSEPLPPRPPRAARANGVERAEDVREVLALVVGASARNDDDVVKSLRVERPRIDHRSLVKVGGLEGLHRTAPPAPALEIAGRLDVVMAIEQEHRRAGG